jgi:PhzF family phenazine biosynthesis protein
MKHTFWLVDAFTDCAFSGNPAGVFIVDEFPGPMLMQLIAAELNWSQTAFVKRTGTDKTTLIEDADHFHIRWFSPRDEAPICGHATLASAHILFENKLTKTNKITFDSLAGQLTVTKEQNDWLTLDFPQKKLVECAMPPQLQQSLIGPNGPVDIVSVLKDDSIIHDETIYVVTLRNQADLATLTPDLRLIESLDYRAVCITTTGRLGYDYESRYFAPRVGIPEDPVCGSSHCRLGPLWANRLAKSDLMSYQASKRGGFIKIGIEGDRVTMSSKAVTVCESKFDLKMFDQRSNELKRVA